MDTRTRRDAVTFLLALSVRVLFIYFYGWENRLYDELWDEQIYWDMGRNLVEGRGFTVSFGRFTASPGPTSIEVPGYPLFLGAIIAMCGESMRTARLVQAVLGAASCVCVARIADRVCGQRAGAWAGTITALYVPLVMYTRVLQAEVFFIAAFTGAVWATLRFVDRPTSFGSFVVGGLWAVALLSRPDGSVFAVVAGAYVLGTLWVRERTAMLRRVPVLLPALAVLSVLWGGWIVRNYQLHGALVPMTSTTGMGLWSANYLRYQRTHNPSRYPAGVLPEHIDVPDFAQLSEVQRDAALGRIGLEFIRANPLTFAYYGLTRLNVVFPMLPRRMEFQPVESDGPYVTNNPTALVEFPLYNTPIERVRVWSFRVLFLCAVAGVFQAVRRRDYRATMVVLLILTLPPRMLTFQGGERARLMIDPFIAVLAAGFLAERFSRRQLTTTAAFCEEPCPSGSLLEGKQRGR